MVPELEKAGVTELQVRMDCNGCVQRIKKAMQGIDGVYSVYVDFAQQKLTVVGSADPAKIVRAIKKTRKIATICSHTEPGGPSGSDPPPAEPVAGGDPPAAEPGNPPPAEAAPPTEPPNDTPPPEAPAPEVKPSPEAQDAAPPELKDTAEVHMVHHYPHSYAACREHWNHNVPPSGHHEMRHAAPYVIHSYSSHRPSPYLSEYGYIRSPPRDNYHYYDGYHQSRRTGREITTMFSDENPNACSIS